jgi:hypothetical protein
MIAFVTTCRNREQHLRQTLPKNLADNASYPDCKFIVVDYGSEYDIERYIITEHAADLVSGRLVFYSFKADKFRMAHAKNLAHRLGMLEGADILLNIDADNFTGPGFAEYVAEQFRQEENVFLWTRVRPLDGSSRLPRGCSGRIAVRANDFLKVGGYDEKYDTWGPDDKDFNARLRMLGLEGLEIDPRFIGVILHNDKMRFKEYRHAQDCDSGDFAVSPDCPIANFGNFGCGTVWRNFGCEPIELLPLPSRIFGIGMHKTGTTSLHHAFEILGYESAHWKSAHWAKAIWREMNTSGSSRTLEKSYALCDLPIPLLYEQLDVAYPGSKFILTLRREDSWIETVRKHWDHKFNKFRKNWGNDPFTDRIHSVLYGRPDFHAPTMLKRYRRHNREVLKYFKGRPDDLLVMDLDCGAGWPELCAFLGKPLPRGPYPHKFKSRARR